MIETGLNDNQNIVLDYLKNGDSPSPFINIHVFWADYFNYCLNSQVTDIQAEVYEAYSGLDSQEQYEVLQEYGRWGINGGLD